MPIRESDGKSSGINKTLRFVIIAAFVIGVVYLLQ